MTRSADDDAIKESYKRLYPKADAATQLQLNRAKLILLDPTNRREYIEKLEEDNNQDGLTSPRGLVEVRCEGNLPKADEGK